MCAVNDAAVEFLGKNACGLVVPLSSPSLSCSVSESAFSLFLQREKVGVAGTKARLLAQAEEQLKQGNLEAADALARKALTIDTNSIQACRILADATEKENDPETVAWRAQIARLDPGLDSQLNLASAALRFGQLDMARDALARVRARLIRIKPLTTSLPAGFPAPRAMWPKKSATSQRRLRPSLATILISSTSLPCRSCLRIQRRMRRRVISSTFEQSGAVSHGSFARIAEQRSPPKPDRHG